MKKIIIILIVLAISAIISSLILAKFKNDKQTADISISEHEAPLAENETNEKIKQLFVEKYPSFTDTIKVTINQETQKHARGIIKFVSDASGGIFLATKIDEKWQIVFDGNGTIPCSLSKYEFPDKMLSDCAK